MLKIYNTLIQKKEYIDLNKFFALKIYICGVTVYDYCHIGHARIFIFFDSIIRYLKYLGCNVIYVRNITDIDDKIILKSKQLSISFDKIVSYYIYVMKKEFKCLNLLNPSYEPRATHFINIIVNIVYFFYKSSYSYQSNNEDLYYFVNKYLKYGNISNRSIFDNFTFSRQNKNIVFKNFLYDFVLWKISNIVKPFWKCSFGKGRPGWHIECSIMSMYYLGDTLDIHGGGLDLIFPHHENECAQSESITKKLYSNIWMHVGFVENNKIKMSKSLKNYISINFILQKYNNEIIRYFILSAHYRTPLEFCFYKLELAKTVLIKFYLLLNINFYNIIVNKNNIYEKRFFYSMNNDFNIIECFAIFFDLLYEINNVKYYSLYKFLSLIKLLKNLGNIIGFFYLSDEKFFNNFINDKNYNINLSENEINNLIFDRSLAKINKNWEKADFIRNYLFNFGIILEDKKYETLWKKF